MNKDITIKIIAVSPRFCGVRSNKMPKVVVEKLPHILHDGDWHDKPLKWTTKGPNKEFQNFSTKKNALEYAKYRRRSESDLEAIQKYCADGLD